MMKVINETSDDYDPPQLFNKSANIYSEPSVAEASFNPADYQRAVIPTSLLTQK